ncbi:hypothetical protein FHX81_6478 [Saccharothrix saharensis]|uniref:Uncharacterized protein n=1 Tax=Saccharothrix saharensis TaxID=571190 RepID=A0A543JMH4_9PSEU|nr:hypothetical protein [Saccharothrix saharensis]TQM84040.1 hypothetical protein FHX81_6478 [Saccharothrix saharensis]
MTRDPAAIEEDVALLDAVLEPVAKAPVDLSDPDWMVKLRAAPHPLDRAGVRPEAEAVLAEILDRYAADEVARPGLRALFDRYTSFRWAVNPRFPTTPDGVRSALLLLSVRDQGADTRDELMALWALCDEARAAGVAVDPILREVAAISSDVDRYGMGSVRDILLDTVR